jgi:predicted aspartyl protease
VSVEKTLILEAEQGYWSGTYRVDGEKIIIAVDRGASKGSEGDDDANEVISAGEGRAKAKST